MGFRWVGAVALLPISLAVGRAATQPQPVQADPFAILKPDITIDIDDQRKLDARQVVLKILPAKGHELAVLAAGALDATSATLSDKVNDIAALKRNSKVPQIGRFSNPPALADLDALTLDDVDVDALEDCRPGDCAMKLSEQEIDELRRAEEGTPKQEAVDAVNRQFRRIVLDRVNDYLDRGLAGIPAYATDSDVDLPTAFATLLHHTAFVGNHAPQLGSYLARYPDAPPPPGTTSSFLYWSKEEYAWKPIVSVTHVTIVNPPPADTAPELLIASREVFATRYTSGALVLTLLLRGDDRAPHYLVYVNRTWVDGLHAFWRPFVNHRIRSQARRLFADARARIEAPGDRE